MASSVRVCDKDQRVEVVHHGRLTLVELKDVRAKAAEMLVKENLSRLLVDGRGADLTTLNVVDTYEFSASLDSALPFTGRLRIAVLVAQEQFEKSVFAETVARNRGVNIRMFLDLDEANQWLTEST